MLQPQSDRTGEKAFQKARIPHKIGMFVRHQKATAHWLCSIWPNMEGKNAAFSRNQNGKKKKKGEGFLACCVHSEVELSHSLHSGHRVGSLSKQHDWWWCRTCRDIPAQSAHRHTHTCMTLKSKKGTRILSLLWHFIFKHTQKLSSLSHMSSVLRSQLCSLKRRPLEGNIPLSEKAAVWTPQSSAEVRNGLFIWPPLAI